MKKFKKIILITLGLAILFVSNYTTYKVTKTSEESKQIEMVNQERVKYNIAIKGLDYTWRALNKTVSVSKYADSYQCDLEQMELMVSDLFNTLDSAEYYTKLTMEN